MRTLRALLVTSHTVGTLRALLEARRTMSVCRLLALTAFALGQVSAAHAHDPGLSALDVTVRADEVHAHLAFARREIELLHRIDRDGDGAISPVDFDHARPGLAALADELVAFAVGNQPVRSRHVSVDLDESDAVHLRLTYPRPPGGPLVIRSSAIGKLTLGHRQYAVARDARGTSRAERVLDAANPVVEITGVEPSRLAVLRQFLLVGVEHIAAGYDHLLFLVALLLGARGFWAVARMITAFTVAHSMTLALATLDVVRIPATVVEPLIAASIVYVGVANLRSSWWAAKRSPHTPRPGHDAQPAWLLTFGFGLVHGMGFASALQDLGIGPRGAFAVPLIAFNAGVELAQLAVAATLLPLIGLAERRPRLAPSLARACSGLVIVAGVYWLLERTFWP